MQALQQGFGEIAGRKLGTMQDGHLDELIVIGWREEDLLSAQRNCLVKLSEPKPFPKGKCSQLIHTNALLPSPGMLAKA
jgi:hypothetical protein